MTIGPPRILRECDLDGVKRRWFAWGIALATAVAGASMVFWWVL